MNLPNIFSPEGLPRAKTLPVPPARPRFGERAPLSAPRLSVLNGSALLAAILLAGCGDPPAPASTPPSAPPVAATTHGLPTQAQPKLQTLKLWLGADEMITELALTPVQQQTGMMFRTNMAENTGMLFPLPFTERAGFWMMNCPLPLSAAYIDPDGVILEIHELHPHDTNAVVADSDNIRFVLETPQGWFLRHNVSTGMVVRTERGGLMETFFKK